MNNRKHERLGWLGGWLGSFIWVLILSVLFFVQGKTLQASLGILIVVFSVISIFGLAPWRYPTTHYRRLMIPIYTLLLLAIVWAMCAFDDPRQMGFTSWWSVLILMPVLSPLFTIGKRCWNDGET